VVPPTAEEGVVVKTEMLLGTLMRAVDDARTSPRDADWIFGRRPPSALMAADPQ
jgi:hypothetical protein